METIYSIAPSIHNCRASYSFVQKERKIYFQKKAEYSVCKKKVLNIRLSKHELWRSSLAELDSLLLCLRMGASGLSLSLTFKKILESDVVKYACSSGCWRLRQMGSLRPGVQSQFGQYRKTWIL